MKLKLDEKLARYTTPPKIRVAANRDTPSEIVGEIFNALEVRQQKGQISQVTAELNERSKL